VGHAECPYVELPAPEAYFTDNIRWYNQWGFAHDWLTGWAGADDRIWWEADVVAAGRYEVTVKYTCPADSVGTRLRIEADGDSVEAALAEAFDPPPRQRPTRFPKKRFIQTFKSQRLGELVLKEGPQRITIRAVDLRGSRVCDLKAIGLRRLD
jgi:hypothetical protein